MAVEHIINMDSHDMRDAIMDPMMMIMGGMLAMSGAYMAIAIQVRRNGIIAWYGIYMYTDSSAPNGDSIGPKVFGKSLFHFILVLLNSVIAIAYPTTIFDKKKSNSVRIVPNIGKQILSFNSGTQCGQLVGSGTSRTSRKEEEEFEGGSGG